MSKNHWYDDDGEAKWISQFLVRRRIQLSKRIEILVSGRFRPIDPAFATKGAVVVATRKESYRTLYTQVSLYSYSISSRREHNGRS